MPFAGLEHIVRTQEPLARHTWFRLGGPAEYFAEPTTREELAELIRRATEQELPVRLLGGGSNVLVRDEGVPGMVIHLSAPCFTAITVRDTELEAGSGAKLSHVVSTAVREGLSGFESLVGVPGTIGGALRRNASAHGVHIGQWVTSATVMTRDGQVHVRERSQLRFAHRQSNLDELVILGAVFELEREEPRQLVERMQKLWILQKASQPVGNLGAGLVFKDPGGISAASLIEQAGLKGTRVGEASINERHANFIEVGPGGTARDVLRLIELMRTRVAEQLGVELELDLKIW